MNLRERSEEQIARYQNPDNHPKGPWTAGDLMANVKGGRYVASLHFPIKNPNTGEEHLPSSNGNWRFSRDTIAELMANNEIYFGEDGKGRPKLKRFYCDVKAGITYPTIWDFVPLNTEGSAEMAELLGSMTAFENPKPSGLLFEIVKLGSTQNGIILDFFAGSGTTAQAVLELNAQDGGNCNFILVQLPEPTERKDFPTIADTTKERVRRVIKKLETEIAAKELKERKESEGQLPLTEGGCVEDQPQDVQTHGTLKSFPRLTAIPALRLVLRTQSRSVRKLRQERNLCSHPRHKIPQPRRGGMFGS